MTIAFGMMALIMGIVAFAILAVLVGVIIAVVILANKK